MLRDEKFQPIASPPIFTPEAMPGRNTEAERGRLNRGTLTAGLLGLVLGGGEGALRGATGYQGAAQKVLDADYQRRADAVKNRNAQGQALYADQYEAYKDDTRRVDALADNQRQENRDAMNAFGADMRAWNTENATRMRLYNNGQVNALKAQALEIAQQRANAGDMTAGANYQKAIAQIEQMGAEADLKGAEFDRKTAQQVVDNAFKERQVTSGELNAKANLTRAQTDAGHKAWQQGHGNFMAGLAAERNRLAAQRGQKQPVTRDQTLKIREELAKADATINTLRRGAGAEPDKKKKPEEYALWLERRNGAERAAQEVRGLLNEKAAMIGYRFDGAGYVPAGAPDSAQVQASKQVGSAVTGFFNVPPVTLPPAPNAPVNRGVQPTINPQAQSGNRVAPKPTATPKASTPTKTTKTAPGSRDEWRERVLAHLAKKAGSK